MRGAAPNRSPPTSTGSPSCVAPEPAPDWFLVDRYWAGALLKDIASDADRQQMRSRQRCRSRSELANYRRLGLPAARSSPLTGAGMAELRAALAGGATLLVGQSGVGKSSIVNALVAAMRRRRPPS